MITYAIGDIHGRHDLLLRALDAIEAEAAAVRIVFLGDYVDRGPDSCGVLRTLMDGPRRDGDEWVCLKGNHEDMMARALSGGAAWRSGERYECWLFNGGAETLGSFAGSVPDDVLSWCASLLPKYETKNHFFVHAGVRPHVRLADQEQVDLLWIRDEFLGHEGDFGKHVVYGHTPRTEPVLARHRTGIDTGAWFTGRLSAACFDPATPGGPQSILTIR